MNNIQKIAFEQQKQKIALLQQQKSRLMRTLLEDPTFRQLHTQEQTLVIELSKKQTLTKQEKQELKQIQTQKQNRAKELGMDAQLLSQQYVCSKCQDKCFVNNKECVCLKQAMSKYLLEESGINTHMDSFDKVKFDIFEKPDLMQKIYQTAHEWTQKFKTSQIKNWGFFGLTGTGKTHLMLTMANQLINDGHFIAFTTAFNLNQQMLSQHTDFENKNRDYLSKYLDCQVLFIDDLGTEPTYNNVTENYLYLIVNQRTMEGKPIVFSTNLDMAQFEDRYGERIFSRLINKRSGKALWFDGQDLRLKKQ